MREVVLVENTSLSICCCVGQHVDAPASVDVIEGIEQDLYNTDQKNEANASGLIETADLRVFIHGERGKMAGLKGHHDDRVMALSLANIAAQQAATADIPFV